MPSSAALQRLREDPDIASEAAGLSLDEDKTLTTAPLRLNVRHGAHHHSSGTVALLAEAGGLPMLRRLTTAFYKKAIADPHLEQFIRDPHDPHGERMATWIAEKFGHGTPWSEERATRPRCPVALPHGVGSIVVHDRSSAHFAAWHSPKRGPTVFGDHFHLDDCRVRRLQH